VTMIVLVIDMALVENYIDKKKARIIHFDISFLGDHSSLEIRLFDPTLPNKSIAEDLHWRVATVLHELAEKKRARERILQPVMPSAPRSISSTEITPQFTREERIKRYEQRKAEELAKLHKKGLTEEHKEVLLESKKDSAIFQRNIVGLDYRTVSTFLTEERISSVDVDTVIKKLGHLVELANVNGKMLGKRISNEENINLRQINWIVDGGVTQIRFYIEDVKQGYFVLRGIMSKKNESQQTRYIRQLLTDIVRERILYH
jgi:hypothetical protein